jgi:UDPglucose 6-dehydrogenase
VWAQFHALELERLRNLLASSVVIELRNIYHPEEMDRHGFAYACIGRPPMTPTFAGVQYSTADIA